MIKKIWIKYPHELLTHAKHHLSIGTDFDLKMAFICTDNAVEIMIKEFLYCLNADSDKTIISKGDIDKASKSFFELINLCKKNKPCLLDDRDIDGMLRYHNIRNAMYHDGSGITVTASIASEYIDNAQILFMGLFEEEAVHDTKSITEQKLGEYSRLRIEFVRKFRAALRPRGNEFAYYWKADLCTAIGMRFLKKYSYFNFFDNVWNNGIDPEPIDIQKIEYFTDLLVYLSTELDVFLNTEEYQKYLRGEIPEEKQKKYFVDLDEVIELLNLPNRSVC